MSIKNSASVKKAASLGNGFSFANGLNTVKVLKAPAFKGWDKKAGLTAVNIIEAAMDDPMLLLTEREGTWDVRAVLVVETQNGQRSADPTKPGQVIMTKNGPKFRADCVKNMVSVLVASGELTRDGNGEVASYSDDGECFDKFSSFVSRMYRQNGVDIQLVKELAVEDFKAVKGDEIEIALYRNEAGFVSTYPNEESYLLAVGEGKIVDGKFVRVTEKKAKTSKKVNSK